MKRLIRQAWRRKWLAPVAGLVIVDVIVFGGTDPQQVPSFMLIVGFVLICLTVYGGLKALLALVRLAGLPLKRQQGLPRTGTVLFGGCLALQSVGQLSSRDVVVLSLFTGLLYLYTTYARRPRGI